MVYDIEKIVPDKLYSVDEAYNITGISREELLSHIPITKFYDQNRFTGRDIKAAYRYYQIGDRVIFYPT